MTSLGSFWRNKKYIWKETVDWVNWDLFVRYELNQDNNGWLISNLSSAIVSNSWSTRSKAFSKSLYITSTWQLLLKESSMNCCNDKLQVKVNLPGLKPCWLLFNILSIGLIICTMTNFFNDLLIFTRSAIERSFSTLNLSPFLKTEVIKLVFQTDGYTPSSSDLLYKMNNG